MVKRMFLALLFCLTVEWGYSTEPIVKNGSRSPAVSQSPPSSPTQEPGHRVDLMFQDTREDERAAFQLFFNHENLVYQKEDTLSIRVVSQVHGYLYVVNGDRTKAVLLYPDKNTNNKMEPGQEQQLPPPKVPYKWRLSGDQESETLTFLLSRSPLKAESIHQYIKEYKDVLPDRVKENKKLEVIRESSIYRRTIELQVVSQSVNSGVSSRTKPSEQSQGSGKRIACLFSQTHTIDLASGLIQPDRNIGFRAGNYIRIKRALIDFGKFDEILALVGPEMNKENVYAMIKKLKDKTAPNDLILIYWEGHGLRWPERSLQSGQIEKHESLALSTIQTHQNSFVPTNETVIRDDEIADMLLLLSERKVILMVQACHSGGLLANRMWFAPPSKSVPEKPNRLENIQMLLDLLANKPYDYQDFTQYLPQVLDTSDVINRTGQTVTNQRSADRQALSAPPVEGGYSERFTKQLPRNASGLHANHPQLAVIVSCRAEELAWSPVLVPTKYKMCRLACGDSSLLIGPFTFALLAVLTDTEGKLTKVPGKVEFDDFAKVLNTIIQANGMRIAKGLEKEDPQLQNEQIPVILNNAGRLFIKP